MCPVCYISPLMACLCPIILSHRTRRWWSSWGMIRVKLQSRLRDHVVRIYLLYLVGITLFIDKSATAVDVVYLKYFRDLDLVVGYSWGAAALARLYRELNKAACWNCGQVSGYFVASIN